MRFVGGLSQPCLHSTCIGRYFDGVSALRGKHTYLGRPLGDGLTCSQPTHEWGGFEEGLTAQCGVAASLVAFLDWGLF
jgi:hypothetical protein